MSTLYNQNRKIKIALCQITCGENKTENFNICKNMITEAKRQDAKVNSYLVSFDFLHSYYTLCIVLDGFLA